MKSEIKEILQDEISIDNSGESDGDGFELGSLDETTDKLFDLFERKMIDVIKSIKDGGCIQMTNGEWFKSDNGLYKHYANNNKELILNLIND